MTGLYVLLAVVVAAAAFGLYRKRTDGRLRPTAGSQPLAGAPATAADRPAGGHADPEASAAKVAALPERILTAATLGQPLGERATLVQFSSAFCSPCRATRRILTDIAATVPGVEFVEVDAEDHLELVRAVGVTRTPTVFLLDADGDVRNRAVGQPRKDEVLAALAAVTSADA